MSKVKILYRRLTVAFGIFWNILKVDDFLFYVSNFQMLLDLLELILKVADTGKHHISKIANVTVTGKETELVTVWVGSGINSSYYDRVMELVEENNELKKKLGELSFETKTDL